MRTIHLSQKRVNEITEEYFSMLKSNPGVFVYLLQENNKLSVQLQKGEDHSYILALQLTGELTVKKLKGKIHNTISNHNSVCQILRKLK